MTLANWFLNVMLGLAGGAAPSSGYMLFEDADRIALEDDTGLLKLE